jgi:hypothetical protein
MEFLQLEDFQVKFLPVDRHGCDPAAPIEPFERGFPQLALREYRSQRVRMEGWRQGRLS